MIKQSVEAHSFCQLFILKLRRQWNDADAFVWLFHLCDRTGRRFSWKKQNKTETVQFTSMDWMDNQRPTVSVTTSVFNFNHRNFIPNPFQSIKVIFLNNWILKSREMNERIGRGSLASNHMAPTKTGKGDSQPLIPMNLFAAWDLDRTPPNCVPRFSYWN